MKKICFPSSNKYLDYPCHYKLNDYFSGINISNSTEDDVINFLQQRITKRTYSQDEKKIFNKLYHYLRGDAAFGWQDPTECCKYINYWLNATVQKSHQDLYNNKSFDIFKNIVNFYNKNKNQSNNDRCISDINYIEPHALRKMGTLYSLYKDYEILKENRRTNDSPCDILIRMYPTYNDALISDGNKDNNFFLRLKHLKTLIDNILPQHEKCKPLIHFKDPDSIKKTENTESEHHRRTHDQKKITQELQRPEEETKLPEPDSRPPETDLPAHTVVLPVKPELPEPHFRGTSNTLERNGSPKTESEETNLKLLQNTYNRNSERQILKPGSDLSEGLIHSDELENPYFPQNVGLKNTGRNTLDDGFLGKVQGAFSSIVEHVEPAPILGVSGGMGALFLLFKYTPVGSFFGGRRGRMHRIPNNFGEYYTVFAPGFPEHDFGNFGNEQYNISYRPE